MEAVAVKSEELQNMSPVGADIDIVKTQLEEHKVNYIDIYVHACMYMSFLTFMYIHVYTNCCRSSVRV